jgi:DNA-binding IclR family transcriptional regulator
MSDIIAIVKRHSTNAGSRLSAGTQSVVRAVRILRAFSDTRAEWSLAELSRELSLSKPTSFRLLGALEQAELVVRIEPAGTYRLGPAAIELGARAQRANPILSAARPELEALTRETGETSSVEILAGATTLILDEVQGGHLIGTSPATGTHWPAHATSTGKVLLAAAQEEEPGLARRLAHEAGGRLAGLTPATIRSASRLAAELTQVTRQGYSTAINELEEGYVALGAPIHRNDGRIIAAISLGGPATRFTASQIPRLVRPLREAATRISRRLGWHDFGPGLRASS